MSKEQMNHRDEKQKGKYKQGSGSTYHEEHANHVPGYGNNSVDPNELSNMDENSN